MRIITDGTRTALVGPATSPRSTPRGGGRDQGLVGSPVVVGNARQYDVGRGMHTGPQRHGADRHGGGFAGRDPGRAHRADRRCEVNLLTAIPRASAAGCT